MSKCLQRLLASTIDMRKSAVLFRLQGLSMALVFLTMLLGISMECRADSPSNWLVGPRFAQQLNQPIAATWSNTTLRAAIESFSRSNQIAVVLDRRIDADASFSLSVANDTVDVAIKKIAQRAEVGSSLLGPVVYFGPRPAAESLKTLAAIRRDEIKDAPLALRKLLAQSRKLFWPELAEPRELVTQLAKEVRLDVQGLNQIPHDLWLANSLPPLVWTDRMTLLLIQFGLTYEIAKGGKAIKILPMPEKIEIARVYPGGAQPQVRSTLLSSKVPAARFTVQDGQIFTNGRSEDHEAITALLSGKPVKTEQVSAGSNTYKLTIEGKQLDQVLSQLEKMLKLKVQIDRQQIQKAGISLTQLISVQVENATLDELLSAVFQTTELTFERKDNLVTIRVK